jgi:hypothetical protein
VALNLDDLPAGCSRGQTDIKLIWSTGRIVKVPSISLQDSTGQPFLQFSMSSITGYALMAQSAARGLAREFDRAARASEQVTRSAAEFSSGDKVEVSPEAVSAAKGGNSAGFTGIEKPMVDLRVAKYSAIANIRVLQTADQLAQAVMQIVK